jgi:hypothetical protein
METVLFIVANMLRTLYFSLSSFYQDKKLVEMMIYSLVLQFTYHSSQHASFLFCCKWITMYRSPRLEMIQINIY